MEEIKRKGAKTMKAIPADILEQLNRGSMETANLVEWLATDQRLLLENLLSETKRQGYLEPILTHIASLKKQTVNTIQAAIGISLRTLAEKYQDREFLEMLSSHRSDMVRGWAAYGVGRDESLSIEQKLAQIQRFSADQHFGVREISWMAVRPAVDKALEKSLEILSDWSENEAENIRRFASEVTRPRGVWCAHIEALKQHPEWGMSILEPLKADPSKYVRDSVGNWLNDASKTKPEFVKGICKKWSAESAAPETAYIVKKALRTLDKEGSA